MILFLKLKTLLFQSYLELKNILFIVQRDRRFDEFIKFFEKFHRGILLQKSGLVALFYGFKEIIFNI